MRNNCLVGCSKKKNMDELDIIMSNEVNKPSIESTTDITQSTSYMSIMLVIRSWGKGRMDTVNH